MRLSDDQKRQFAEQGFLRVRNVIPREKVEAALGAINHWLGTDFDRAEKDTYAKQSYCPELREQPVIKGLMEETPGYNLAEQLTAPGALKPVWRGQVALRFPNPGSPKKKRMGGHIDGTPGDNNGVPPGTIYSFTTLAGIALSDVDRDDAGNFVVWPGSHKVLEEWFRTHTLFDLLDGLPKLDYGDPLQVHWKAGDLLLAHHQTVHGIGRNLSPHIRYAVFFRLHHVNHEELKDQVVRDLWREYEGVREALAQGAQR